MAKRMLIDASHPEEIRVAIVSGNKLEELDYETSNKQQLKGNIYLAKVTRVEPSLQAAFVDYGGNRHGFLAFSEIHPDYYKLPLADRERLIAEEAEAVASEAAADEAERKDSDKGRSGNGDGRPVEIVGGDEIDELDSRRRQRVEKYKIQEVIKRRQIMLVQVVKEERGNKGAALTTYISLAGRYCVLMPNTARGGGVSRKITNATDRRRLKKFLEDLDIPDGMATIVRTAGAERSKAEIRRDFEYLARTWEEIRQTTLQSTAPALIYEEANLIKRSLRDLYSRDIDEVLVEGADGYRVAKDFMKRLTPSHAKRVQQYKEEKIPLFHRYQVESQIDGIHSPQIQLKSGGYIVINPTEALVAIDVNSGKATRERHIEETAHKTNLEASEEIARQLRLRDLAGLIVIDFIDMEDARNQSGVERRLKDALRADRARIQVGRISPFGLLEMSRQRLRPSVVETSMEPCWRCNGVGYVRSTESTALHLLRAVEEEGIRQRSQEIRAVAPTQVALYVLNNKRQALAEIEARYGFSVSIIADDELVPPDLRIERVRGRDGGVEGAEAVSVPAAEKEPEADSDGKDRRRRRPRRRRDQQEPETTSEVAEAVENTKTNGEAKEHEESSESTSKRRRRGRRGGRRRGRRQNAATVESTDDATGELNLGSVENMPHGDEAAVENQPDASAGDDKKPPRKRRSRRTGKPATEPAEASNESAESGNGQDTASQGGKSEPVSTEPELGREGVTDSPIVSSEPGSAPDASAARPAARAAADDGPDDGATGGENGSAEPRKGWWQRLTE